MVVSLLFCGVTFARSHSVNVLYSARIGSQLRLAPGNYNLVINNHSQKPEAAFYKDGKLIGTAPVKLVSEARKISQTEIEYGSLSGSFRPITQIEINGWRDKLVFGNS